jgi:hypothetical protein
MHHQMQQARNIRFESVRLGFWHGVDGHDLSSSGVMMERRSHGSIMPGFQDADVTAAAPEMPWGATRRQVLKRNGH